ncbi:MAG: hypothetical protein KJO26_00410 [Deltaproteobacteria bacterium]|nr:hypothetical protein [Deltaproteobacteria bacterium]
MKNFDRLYFTKFDMDFDPEYAAVEDFFDFISDGDTKTCHFMDEDMNDLEDLFWDE